MPCRIDSFHYTRLVTQVRMQRLRRLGHRRELILWDPLYTIGNRAQRVVTYAWGRPLLWDSLDMTRLWGY